MVFLYCRKCDKVREHEKRTEGEATVYRCRTCRGERTEHADRNMRSPFGRK